MLISIIVPYFNRLNCLPALVESVVSQTYKNWELIIVDDCSDDSTEAKIFLDSLHNDRIRYARHDTNLNGAQARNTGLSLCHGDYVAFLDSDDVWNENKLALQLQQILKSPVTSKTFLYGALQKEYVGNPEKNSILPKRGKHTDESVSDYLFDYAGLMQTSTFFLPAIIAKKIKFNPTLKRHQDYDFVLRAEALGVKFEFIDTPLCSWICLQGEENISTKGCQLSFSITWFNEYQKYMTITGSHGYLSKQMFYIAVKSGEVLPYYRYVLGSLGVFKSLKVIWGNIKFVVNRH